MKNSLHVIVGTGPLGIAVMEELLADGKRCVMINRSGEGEVGVDVQLIAADATDHESILEACEGAEVIYNCTNAPYTKWPDMLPPIVDGIMYAAQETGARLVHADNLYMYGMTYQHLTEDLPYESTEPKGKTRATIATKLMDKHHKGHIQVAIGRGSNVFGPRVIDSTVGRGVFEAALKDQPAQVLGDATLLHTYTYIKDFAKGLVMLGERDSALGHVWHIPSAPTISTKEFITKVYRQLGKEPQYRVAPTLGIQFLSLFNASMRETKRILYMFEQPLIVDHTKYDKAFGAEPTNHELAIQETIAWYKEYLTKK